LSNQKSLKLSTDVAEKAKSIILTSLKDPLAIRISAAIGISHKQALERLKNFPRKLNKRNGVLYQEQRPFVEAFLNSVEELEPAYKPICSVIRSKITYSKRKASDRSGSWMTMILAGVSVALKTAYDGPGMYRLVKEGDLE